MVRGTKWQGSGLVLVSNGVARRRVYAVPEINVLALRPKHNQIQDCCIYFLGTAPKMWPSVLLH